MKKLTLFLSFIFVVSCTKDPIIYTLTTSANPADGGTVSPSTQQYDEGKTATITATASSEYVFQSWSGATGSTNSTSVVMNSDKSVTANFVKKKYALTTTVEGEGTVTEKVIKAGAATDYNSGTIVELTAVPSGEWLFVEWKGDVTGTENPTQITIDKAKSVTAVFVKKQYPLTMEIEGEGTVSEKVIKAGVTTEYNSGTIVELTAEPTGDWKFIEWKGDLTGSENPTQITIDKAKNVTAVFEIKNLKTEVTNTPTFFLPNVNSFADENNLNLSQVKQPLWLETNLIYKEQDVIADNDWVGPSDFLVDDFNNDGYNDVFFSYLTGAERSKVPFTLMLYDDSSKSMVDKSSLIQNNIGQAFARKTVSADFNSDGIKDFVSASHPELPTKEFSYLDIVLSNGNGWEQITLSKQSRVTYWDYENSGYYHGVDVGDVDEDGDIDIVVAMWHNPEKGVSLWRNDGQGNFSEENKIIKLSSGADLDKENSSFVVDLLDFNSDGCLDLVYSWGPTLIKTGNCDGTFGPEFLEFEVGGHGGALAYDLDNDNDNDLIFRKETNGEVSISIYENSGDNTFTFTNNFPAQGIGEPIDLKDINNDGKLDIIGRDALPWGDENYYNEDFNRGVDSGTKVLLGITPFDYSVNEYPITSQMEGIKFNNEKRKLEWSSVYFTDIKDVNPLEQPHLENLRGNIQKWIIYRSDNSFFHLDNDVTIYEIEDSEIEKEKLSNNVFKYSFELDDNLEGYYRIGYIDNNGVINSLSYEIQLSFE